MGSNPPANSSLFFIDQIWKMQALYAVCEQGWKKASAEGKRDGERGQESLESFFSGTLSSSSCLFFSFVPFSFCFSMLTGSGTNFTGGIASDHIWLSFSPSLHFCLCLVSTHPRSISGGYFCVNYKESEGERSQATLLSLFFFPSLSGSALIPIIPFSPLSLVPHTKPWESLWRRQSLPYDNDLLFLESERALSQ